MCVFKISPMLVNILVRRAGLSLLVVLGMAGCATGQQITSLPAVPVNLAPEEQSIIRNNSRVMFQWQASDYARAYEFHIFNRKTGDINRYYKRDLSQRNVCDDNGLCSLELDVEMPILNDHAWRVRAFNDIGFSVWSRTQFDVVDATNVSAIPPSVPSPVQPLVGTSIRSNSLVDFIWRSVPEAMSYDFHLFDAVNGEIIREVVDIPATTVCQGSVNCQITRTVILPTADNHAWRVRANNRFGRSEWTRVLLAVQ